MLTITEYVASDKKCSDGEAKLYEVGGHLVNARKEFKDYLESLRRRISYFVASCPHMESLGDNQDYVTAFCKDMKIPKPCYGEFCAGCDDPNKYCEGN